MIAATFGTAPMAPARTERAETQQATARSAREQIRVAAITRGADRKQPMAERRVHDV